MPEDKWLRVGNDSGKELGTSAARRAMEGNWDPSKGRFIAPVADESPEPLVEIRKFDWSGKGGPALLAVGRIGVLARGTTDGLYAESAAADHAGAAGVNTGEGVGVVGKSKSGVGVLALAVEGNGVALSAIGAQAAQFKGDVVLQGNMRLSGDITLEGAGDCCEQFQIGLDLVVDPGTVMVAEAELLTPCKQAYDKKVIGVVSGAGDLRPGIILGNRSTDSDQNVPVALVGRVMCKVDAGYAPIEVGDPLTTSPTHGHAMKASDREKALGTILGKALRPLDKGTGLIPIIVALQ